MVAYAARTFKTQTRPRAATYLCQVYRNWGEDLTIPGPLTDLFLDPSKPGDYVAVDALQTLASWSNRFCGQKDRFIRKFKAMLAAKPRLKTIVGAPKQRRLKHSDLSVLHKALLRDPNQLETATGASVHTSATSDVQDQNQSPVSYSSNLPQKDVSLTMVSGLHNRRVSQRRFRYQRDRFSSPRRQEKAQLPRRQQGTPRYHGRQRERHEYL